VATLPLQADIEGKLMQVALRATSMGNALMHVLFDFKCDRNQEAIVVTPLAKQEPQELRFTPFSP
jgi:hypothetical protein